MNYFRDPAAEEGADACEACSFQETPAEWRPDHDACLCEDCYQSWLEAAEDDSEDGDG